MSIPIDCPHCGRLVGILDLTPFVEVCITDSSLIDKVIKNLQAGIVDCSCHQDAKRTQVRRVFGLIRQTRIDYPETETFSIKEEYAGPMNKIAFYFTVILRGNDGVRVNDRVAYWDVKNGFFGTGIDEFEKLREKA